jgi:hypothetical protein
MSEETPYEKLGIAEDASFEEVKAARDRLMAMSGDPQQSARIEAAYDSVLMERLRLRQEGKIKVPELIRFPERPLDILPNLPISPIKGTSAWRDWWQRLRDTPDQNELLWSTGVFGGLSGLSWVLPQMRSLDPAAILQVCLALGLGYSLYALNRKERRFGRACFLSIVGLLVGLILGSAIASAIHPALSSLQLVDDQATTLFTFFVLWMITSFLR